MNDIQMQESQTQEAQPRDKLIVATAALCGCFGCHMSLLDIDERILQLVELVEFDRSLDDPSLHFVVWRQHRLQQTTMPTVGGSMELRR